MNQDPLNFEEQSRQARESTRKLKQRMIIVIICLAVFTVIAIPLISFLDNLEKQQSVEELESKKESTIIFFEPNWELDIMKDPAYLALDRTVYYNDVQYGITVALDQKNVNKYGPAVEVLNQMIQFIIAGDADGYNQLLSVNYLENNDFEPPFTMQQLYDIRISKVQETIVNGEYTQYEFELEYRIRNNDGTFRTDIGSDESKRQYVILSNSTSNDVLIDQILGYKYK
jgi:hypothetical protein